MTLTPNYLEAAARALELVKAQAKVRWLDQDDNEHEAHLRGWDTREDDVRDRDVRTTNRTGLESAISFGYLVDLTLAHRIAEA